MGRRIVIVRHGERVDYTFGNSWIERCFNSEGKYTKLNLNLPDDVIQRKGLPKSFFKDCPLTQIGMTQGKLVGKGLQQESILRPGFEVYVSPAYRSVQTCTALLEGMQSDAPLKVENCLFEWTGWYSEGIPNFVTVDELADGGYNVDLNYQSFTKLEELKVDEEVANYYTRTYEWVKTVLESSDKDLLLVAHGSTLEVATRQLMGHPPRAVYADLLGVCKNFPYASVAIAEYNSESKKWNVNKPGSITLCHTSVHDFAADEFLIH